MKTRVKELSRLCNNNISVIFDDIASKGFIDRDSQFYKASKRHARSTCFESLYPLVEVCNLQTEQLDFFLFNSYLFSFAIFLDEWLDCLRVTSRQIRSSQIASYLLLQYYDWLKSYAPEKVNMFYQYYERQTHYVIAEKRWDSPADYVSYYSQRENIWDKQALLLFPIILLGNEGMVSNSKIFDIFVNYYSYILLTDDLLDADADIQNCCLTYPIALFYNVTGELPHNSKALETVRPQIIKVLDSLLRRLNGYLRNSGTRSYIIRNKIQSTEKILEQNGWR